MYSTFEQSRFGGRPYHLFIFRRQGVSLRFASTGPKRDIVIGAHTYAGGQIERSAIRQTVERAKDKLTIKVPYVLDVAGAAARGEPLPVTQPLGDWWRPFIPFDPIQVVCLAGHHGDPDPPIVEWMGWAVQPEYGDVEMTLSCDPNPPAGEARGQGAKFQRACWKAVYSTGIRGCNLDPAPLRVSGPVDGINGLTLTADAFAESTLSLLGGNLSWTRSNGITEERPIMAHSGNSVVLLYPGEELDIGRQVTAEPNCPGNWSACEIRGNTINYGGAIYKPVKDPASAGESMSWG